MPEGYKRLASVGADVPAAPGFARLTDPDGHIVLQGPSGAIYSRQDYDAYVARKTAANETPRAFDDYAQYRDHWAAVARHIRPRWSGK